MKIFIDTNVLIDFITNRREEHESSMTFLSRALSDGNSFVVNSLSLANADFLLSRYYKVDNFPERFLLLGNRFSVCKMDGLQAQKALTSRWPDFEDALQYQSALAHGCNIIVTRDKKGFKGSVITTMTPEEYIDEYSNEA